MGCTFDGAQLRLFVDGNVVKTTNTTKTIRVANGTPLRIGSNSPYGGDSSLLSFDGLVDQLKIFDFVLSDRRMCAEAFRANCQF